MFTSCLVLYCGHQLEGGDERNGRHTNVHRAGMSTMRICAFQRIDHGTAKRRGCVVQERLKGMCRLCINCEVLIVGGDAKGAAYTCCNGQTTPTCLCAMLNAMLHRAKPGVRRQLTHIAHNANQSGCSFPAGFVGAHTVMLP